MSYEENKAFHEAHELLTKWMDSPMDRMALVYRYSSFPQHQRESVAEHTYFVMQLSWILAQHIEERENDGDGATMIDYALLLEKGLFHDIDESITGDIIRPFKYSSMKLNEEMTRASIKVLEENYSELPGGGSILMDRWRTAKDLISLEGRIIDFADVWSVWLYLRREVALGNRAAATHLNIVAKRIENTDWHERIEPYASAMSAMIRKEGE